MRRECTREGHLGERRGWQGWVIILFCAALLVFVDTIQDVSYRDAILEVTERKYKEESSPICCKISSQPAKFHSPSKSKVATCLKKGMLVFEG